jgi:stage V sporulation protein AD
MTFKYNNVYINDFYTIAGKLEYEGPLGTYFDKHYSDYYHHTKTFEQAEASLLEDSVNSLLNKIHKSTMDIDIHVSGDLLNQIVSTNYAASKLSIPLIGVYGACSTSNLGLIVASNMIEANEVNNSLVSTSSHNSSAEKQFRYPVEYGAPKPKRSTYTVTGAVSCYLSKEKTGIKIESGTIGRVVDMGIKDVFNMGAVMAPAAAHTIITHLQETNRDASYYDLILTGDLGRYGKDILKEYMLKQYKIDLKNLDDAACMIYDLDKQPVCAGGSGPSCLPLVVFSYIVKQMKLGKLKKVLLVATGALMNTTMVNQKLSIPAISHAISLEVI